MINYEERRRQRLLGVIRKRQKNRAESKGGKNDADRLLNTAAAVISEIIDKGIIGEGDVVALEFLRNGLREYLDHGVPIDRSLCIDKERGAPKMPELLPIIAYVPCVDREYSSSNSVNKSLETVAKHFGVSLPTVRSAWNKAGGVKGHQRRKIK